MSAKINPGEKREQRQMVRSARQARRPGPKFSIRQNVWDNWYGYKSGRRVIGFVNTPTETMEQQAQRWLAGRQASEGIVFLYRVMKHLSSLNAVCVVGYVILELMKIESGPWPWEEK